MNHHRSTERRIIYSLIVILIAIQLAIFVVLRANNGRIARATLGEVLGSGGLVTRSLLETRQKQLDESTRVLAGDFGLREAIASGDRPTIASMLDNHEKRAQGLLVAVHDLNQRLLAQSSLLPMNQKLDALAPEASPRAPRRTELHITSLDRGGETLFHLSTAEVKAPARMAFISMGFAIDTRFAEELSTLTGLQFMFLARDQKGDWRLHGSTLPPSVTAAVVTQARGWTVADLQERDWRAAGDKDNYVLSVLPLTQSGGGEVVAVLGKSLDQALEPLRQVEAALLALMLASLVLSALAVYWVTLRMVAPINDSAHRDTLTGLVNRRYFDVSLHQAVDDAQRRGMPLCVLMMDLNKFKAINDSLGHAAGDEVLQVVARRLQQAFRVTDTVARLGGDEFAVILPGVDRQGIQPLLDAVVKKVAEPFMLMGRPASVGTSIGVAVVPQDADAAPLAMERADAAMYVAKKAGRGYAFHEPAPPAPPPSPDASAPASVPRVEVDALRA